MIKIFWTETAIKQRNYIFEYWTERNKSNSYAKRLNIKINDRLSMLRSQPKSGKESDFKDVRVVSLGHYSILYKFKKHQIIVVGFWDNRQEPQKLLNFLRNKTGTQ